MDKYTATELAFKNGYEKGYEAGKPKWISTKERKPTVYDADKYRRVLVIEYGMIALANYLAPCNYPKAYPYWMPLTEQPRKEPTQITKQTADALNKMGKKAHGG